MKVKNSVPWKGSILAATALVVVCSPAWAQGRVLPVDEMARKADVVGVATVESALAHDEPRTGFIYTDFRLNFSEVWKGEASPAFVLMKPGGEARGQKAAIPGYEYDMKPGEKIVVFATPSSLGNHMAIGIGQGLYRVGAGENPPLYRVSQFPKGPGKESRLTLLDLKNEVLSALGKPIEPKPPPRTPETPETPPEKKAEAPGPGPAPSTPAPAVPPQSGPAGESQRWIGGVIIGVILAGLAVVIIWKRKAKSSG